MEINNRAIRKELRGLWPKLRHIWIFDRNFSVPTVDDLKNILVEINNYKVDNVSLVDLYNIGDVWDCDDFSLLATAFVRLNWKLKGNSLPIPFGRVMGNEFRGMAILHSLNICITQDGPYFIDFDDNQRLWKASAGNDSIFFVSI
jgi:hypothetical protein